MYKYSLDIYVMDDDANYPTLQEGCIYMGRIGQVTASNRRSLSGGPAVLTDRKGALVGPTNHVLVRNSMDGIDGSDQPATYSVDQ
jgi:hypothetical protein